MRLDRRTLCGLALTLLTAAAAAQGLGDLGLIVERNSGAVLVVDTDPPAVLARIEGLGDLSHATAVFSPDMRHAFVFARDGGLSKLDLLERRLVKRIVQAGNSIGGAISEDGRLLAVANYEPGGVNLFTTDTLEAVGEIPAVDGQGRRSKVVGLEDAPGNRFVYSLFEAGEIRLLDAATRPPRVVGRHPAGRQPYDGLVTPDGRYYLAGLFGEDGVDVLDLWNPEKGLRRVLPEYGRGERRLPVYKMPHLEGWAEAGGRLFLPGVGRHELFVVDRRDFSVVARVPLHGQPVFAVAQPDGRRVWVNFAPPHNDTVQVVDAESLETIATLKPGKGVLHMEFTPRGGRVWLSVRDENRVRIYDTQRLEAVGELPAREPSGIFFTARAHRIGL
ncbi:MAG: protein NirF [Gammaproteobacteria bacterium]|nr:MAG: protein NirF [Gammaproteobacteria bacterium]